MNRMDLFRRLPPADRVEADTVPLMRDALKGARDTLQALDKDRHSLSAAKIRRQLARCERALRLDGAR